MNIKNLLVASSAVLLIAGVGMGIFIWFDRPATISLQPYNATVVAKGKQIYLKSCASCHGVDLKGQANWTQRNAEGKLPAPPHDPSGHTWHHGDRILFDLTKIGPAKILGGNYKTDMPGFDGALDDNEIIAALSYIKSTWPQDIQKRHDLLNESLRQQEAQN